MKNYYEILEINNSASNIDIKRAHRLLSKKFHPDLNQGNKELAELFLQLQEAYEILSDPYRKKAYDILLKNEEELRIHECKPYIEFFEANQDSINFDDKVTFKWHVFNANIVELKPFGFVAPTGEKTIKIKNIKKLFFTIELIAKDFKSQEFSSKKIYLLNNDYTKYANYLDPKKYNNKINKSRKKKIVDERRIRLYAFILFIIILFILRKFIKPSRSNNQLDYKQITNYHVFTFLLFYHIIDF